MDPSSQNNYNPIFAAFKKKKILCHFLLVTATVKYRKSQFYATNHKSHYNAIFLTYENKKNINVPYTIQYCDIFRVDLFFDGILDAQMGFPCIQSHISPIYETININPTPDPQLQLNPE